MMKQLFMVISLRGTVVTDQIAHIKDHKKSSVKRSDKCMRDSQWRYFQRRRNIRTEQLFIKRMLFFVVVFFSQLPHITFQERSSLLTINDREKKRKRKRVDHQT